MLSLYRETLLEILEVKDANKVLSPKEVKHFLKLGFLCIMRDGELRVTSKSGHVYEATHKGDTVKRKRWKKIPVTYIRVKPSIRAKLLGISPEIEHWSNRRHNAVMPIKETS